MDCRFDRHVHGKKVIVVTNTTIALLYLDKVVDSLTKGNPAVSVEYGILPDGEKFKDMVGFPYCFFFLINILVLRYYC